MKQYFFLNKEHLSVPNDTCRGCFLEASNNLPEELIPIWRNDLFTIRQDAECPVPGFYILSTRPHINSIGDLTVDKASQLGIISSCLRNRMKDLLNIKRVHLILEERKIEPHLHIWFLPLWPEILEKHNVDPKVWNSNILQYLNLFDYEINKERILKFNEIMRTNLKKDHIMNDLCKQEDAYENDCC